MVNFGAPLLLCVLLYLLQVLGRHASASRVSHTLRAQRLKKFKILKFSSEIEHFKRAAHQTPIFCGEFWRSGLNISSEIEIFKRDWKFQSRFIFFNLWALRAETFAFPYCAPTSHLCPFHLNIRVRSSKRNSTSGFGQSSPSSEGVNLHPLNERGMY